MAAKPGSQITTRELKNIASKSELTCSVCLEQLKDPKVLPCCHTFCKQCLQSVAKISQETDETHKSQAQVKLGGSAALSCPKCRAEHEIPEGGVDGFLTDFSLGHDLEVAAVMKEKEKKPSCGQCESSDPSVAYCIECEAFLCEFCSSAHKRMKSYREHNVLPFDMITSDVLKPSATAVKCSKHPGEDSNLYCKTCQQLICRDCTLVEHRSHDFHFANEARQGFEAELVKLVRESKKKLVVYGKELQEVQKAEKFLQSESDSVKKQITASFDAYISALQSRRQKLLAEVDSEYQADSKKVWAHKEFTETAIADVTASLRFAGRAHKCSSDAEMISLTKQAIQHLKSLNKREHKLNDTYQVVDKTAFYSCSHIEQQLLTYGSIATRSPSLQLSPVYGKTAIGDKIVFTVNFASISYRKLNIKIAPTIDITYGHCKKPLNEIVITKTGKSTWTVTMECICGGDHTISASLLGYSANPMTITVSGMPRNGARVRPGPDWSGTIVDGANKGTVTQSKVDTSCHEVYVKWDNGISGGPYRWGKSSDDSTHQYQIELVPSFNIDLCLANTNFSFSVPAHT